MGMLPYMPINIILVRRVCSKKVDTTRVHEQYSKNLGHELA